MIGDPVTPVECDSCHETEYFEMTALAQKSWDNRNLAAKLKRARWSVVGDVTFCPECHVDAEHV